jgi:D-galactarolactone cycloisomerase
MEAPRDDRSAITDEASMKIRRVRSHVLEAELSQPFGWSLAWTRSRTALLVEIETDDGLLGWGECYGPAGPNAAVIEAMTPLLIGADALATEAIWEGLYAAFRDHGQKGLVVQAISGIDIALWDLKGKHFGVPAHRLMGGPMRTEVQAYATGLYRRQSGDPRLYLAEEAAGYVAEGFSATKLKVGFGVKEDTEVARAIREAVGPDIALMIDANHGYDARRAMDLGRRIADLDIGWFEEPVPPEDLDGYREVKVGQPIPVAGGECEFSRFGFRELLTRRAVDVVQPDTCAAGGLSECLKIAAMANAHGIRYVPHVWGTGVALAASLQLLAVLPHNPPCLDPEQPLLEFDRTEHPIRQAILTEPIEHERGVVRVPTGPGLGIEIDRSALERLRVG